MNICFDSGLWDLKIRYGKTIVRTSFEVDVELPTTTTTTTATTTTTLPETTTAYSSADGFKHGTAWTVLIVASSLSKSITL